MLTYLRSTLLIVRNSSRSKSRKGESSRLFLSRSFYVYVGKWWGNGVAASVSTRGGQRTNRMTNAT